MMKRRAFLAGACLLPLAGCGEVLGPGEAPRIYVLGASFPPPPPGPKVSWSLSVARPSTADSLDTVRIPIVMADGTMDFYAMAQFPDRVPMLVQDALVAGFEASNRIDQVSSAQDALQADHILLTEIRDFEAKYDAPDGVPMAIVALSVRLVAAKGRRILASFTTRQTAPAAANSIGAAATAFETALGAAAHAVVAWALAVPAPVPEVKP
jgi:cholesterol transport system auxiliary component